MKALNLHAVGDLRYEEVPNPVRGEGEVLLKIKACGICGSDIPRIFKKGTYHFPTIPGHEFSGQIVEADRPELVGKMAAVFPLLPCRKCASCQVGEYAQCSDYDYYGSRRDGAYAEYLAVKEWNLVPFEGISYEEAAMCEPAAVALHAVGLADIKIGDTVAVFGAGPIGVMLGLWSRASGASRVILCDIDPLKVDFARSLGFDAINSAQQDAAEYIHELTAGRGADACIEGAGATQTWESCIKSVKSFGHVVCMGNPFGDMTLTQGTYSQLLRKQLTIRGTWNSSYNDAHNDWRTALDAISKRIVDVRPLITHKFALADYKQAFDLILSRKEFYSKVMFIPDM
ncbi:MAG: galactitol-1-phosphate 5-dehydrogenase [Bacteroidales bacterium]|nr:galactitol-1-phosphate 5-dehydrogenase [Bacteroidales bacterium]